MAGKTLSRAEAVLCSVALAWLMASDPDGAHLCAMRSQSGRWFASASLDWIGHTAILTRIDTLLLRLTGRGGEDVCATS